MEAVELAWQGIEMQIGELFYLDPKKQPERDVDICEGLWRLAWAEYIALGLRGRQYGSQQITLRAFCQELL